MKQTRKRSVFELSQVQVRVSASPNATVTHIADRSGNGRADAIAGLKLETNAND